MSPYSESPSGSLSLLPYTHRCTETGRREVTDLLHCSCDCQSEDWSPSLATHFWSVHYVPGIILSPVQGLTYSFLNLKNPFIYHCFQLQLSFNTILY